MAALGAAGAGLSVLAGLRNDTVRNLCGLPPQKTTPNRVALNCTQHSAYGGHLQPPVSATVETLRHFINPAVEKNRLAMPKNITVYEMPHEVADGITTQAWSFNGRVPGEIIRVRENTKLKIVFRNGGSEPHSLHFHGQHSPQYDGWEQVPPGAETYYEITARPVGMHPYHCHVPPIGHHIARGLYGLMLVEGSIARTPAFEIVLIFSGWDLNNARKNDLYTFNGIAGYYDKFPIKVGAGQLVRVYLVNMMEYEPLMTFHIHGVTFDIYRNGNMAKPDEHSDVVSLGLMQRAMLEFRLPERGRYMFHPHQSHMAENGAMGWFTAV